MKDLKSLIVPIGMIATIATAAHADVRPWGNTSPYAIGSHWDPFGGTDGPNNFFTGWNSGEGFVPGSIGGQQGWGVSASGPQTALVNNVNPFEGDQHLSLVHQTGISQGTLRGAFSPAAGAGPVGPSAMSIMISISNTGGARYDIIPQAPSQAFLTARVVFNFTGDIFVLDDLDGPGPGGLTFVDTGVDWVAGAYKNLTIEADPDADTLRYYYDGVLIYDNPLTGMFAGTRMEQIVLLSDNFQLAGERGDFDQLSVIPAPGALALLGIAGLVGARRRRHA